MPIYYLLADIIPWHLLSINSFPQKYVTGGVDISTLFRRANATATVHASGQTKGEKRTRPAGDSAENFIKQQIGKHVTTRADTLSSPLLAYLRAMVTSYAFEVDRMRFRLRGFRCWLDWNRTSRSGCASVRRTRQSTRFFANVSRLRCSGARLMLTRDTRQTDGTRVRASVDVGGGGGMS